MLPQILILCVILIIGGQCQSFTRSGPLQDNAAGQVIDRSSDSHVFNTRGTISEARQDIDPDYRTSLPEITLRASTGGKAFDPRGLAFFQPAQVINASALRPEGFIILDYTGDNSAHIEVRLTNFPSGKGPFSYHIHEHRVPEEISEPAVQCMQAKGHLDPEKRGETTPCDTRNRSTCQVGDVRNSY